MNKESAWKEDAQLRASLIKPNQAMRDIRLNLSRRIVEYARQGKTDQAPDVLLEDISFYRDPEQFAREYQKLFRETPILACLTKDLPEPGSYRLFDELGVPIILWRGKDSVVRAFLNICAHRGARLGREECGSTARLTCRFHGWTFDATGKAVGIPAEEQFCGKIDAQKQLVSIPAEERHGLVFVQATPNAKMDLDAHLGAFGHEMELLDFAKAERVIADDFTTPSNWKYTQDTYFENYHLPVLHRESFAHVFAHNLNLFETWGPHHRFTFPHASIYDWMKKPESEWPIDAMPLTYFLFPNTTIAVGSASQNGSLISIHRLFPKAVGELHTKVAVYAPYGVQSKEHLADIEKSFVAIKRAVRDEDYSVTGEAYPGFAALPAGTKYPIGRQEIGVQNFHRNVRKSVGS
jgi:phenylpropionate dioxygenase-like ring-hydroxylating dioxygenase large terminal subunit